MRYLTIIAILLITQTGWCQRAKATRGTVVLTHATLYTITNGVLANSTLVIKDGIIASIGDTAMSVDGVQVIDCTGLSIYPGFIDSGNRLGLSEIGSDARTQDYNEVGIFSPQMKALTAVNPNSVMIPVARVNGITTSLVKPNGGLFCGTAALVNLHGYTPDQMFAGFEGVVMEFPTRARTDANDKRTLEEIKKENEKAMNQLHEVWDKAVEYFKIDSASQGKGTIYYPEFEALLPVIKGERTLLIEVNAADDIVAALKWVEEVKCKKVIFMGVSEGWRVADKIAAAGIAVVVGPVLALPSRAYDRYDKAYANAGLLKKAGVTVAIRTNDVASVRNLPYQAGFAATYGMGKEAALEAITLVPAKMFGVSDRLGSLTKGKAATLFITDGDPFELQTKVKFLFINGWQIPLESRQTLLYDEFLKREPGLGKE